MPLKRGRKHNPPKNNNIQHCVTHTLLDGMVALYDRAETVIQSEVYIYPLETV